MSFVVMILYRKCGKHRSQARRNAGINDSLPESLCLVICPTPLLNQCFGVNHRLSAQKRRETLASRERIPLNMSKLVENPNYFAENEGLLASGININNFKN